MLRSLALATSTMQCFRNIILRSAPKNAVFPYIGMLWRYVFLLGTFYFDNLWEATFERKLGVC